MVVFLIFLELFFINFVLSIDNIVVFSGITAHLEDKKRKQIIFWGSILAITFRILFIVLFIFLIENVSVILLAFFAGLLLLKVAFDLTNKQDLHKQKRKLKSSISLIVLEIIFIDVLLSFDNAIALSEIVAQNSENHNQLLLLILMAVAVFLVFPFLLFGTESFASYISDKILLNYLCMFLISVLAISLIFSGPNISQWLDFMPNWSKRLSKYLLALSLTIDKYLYSEILKKEKNSDDDLDLKENNKTDLNEMERESEEKEIKKLNYHLKLKYFSFSDWFFYQNFAFSL